MKNDRNIFVQFVGPAKIEYLKLQEDVNNEIQNEKEGTEKQKLLKSIQRVIDILKNDPLYGFNIKKNLIPDYYIKTFEINNLRKCDLYGFWRLIYTLKSNDIEIVNIILEFMDHKDYNKRFGYRD